MLARVFVAIGGLILLVLVAALVVPFFVDWTGYRANFEREASRILGRKVTVEGEASARILPFPSLTFTDVRVEGHGDQPALTAERFSMDAELAPFLRGELLIFDMRLDRPKGIVRVSETGAVDWTVRPHTPFQAGDVTIERLTVTEGALTVEHAASGRAHRLTEFNATIAANTLAGPWRVVGSTRLDGALTDFDASTGRLDERGVLRLRVRAKPQRYPFVIEADGGAQVKDGSLEYDGTFRLSAYNAANLLRDGEGAGIVPSQNSNGAPAVADYRISGKFSFDHRRLDVPEFRFETGPAADPYTADGRADLDIGGEPRFSIVATGAQFSFDDRVGDPGSQAGAAIGDRISSLTAFIGELPRPAIPGSVEIALPAIVVGDTTLRDVKLSAQPENGGWSVGQMAVSMPGRATLEASGFVSVEDANVEFDGDMLLAVSQPSGFAAWLSKEVDEAIRRLPAAGFQAKVKLAKERQTFDDLELRLGSARFAGSLQSLTPEGAKPSLSLALDGGHLDVEGLAAFASLFVSQSGESRTEGRDIDLAVTAGPVTATGLTAGKVDTALRLKAGVLDIDRLTVTDLAGANISATGKVTGFPASPAGSFDAAIVSGDIAPLAVMIGERFSDNPVAVAFASRFAALPDLGSNARLNIIGSVAADDGVLHNVLSIGGEIGDGKVTLAYSGTGDLFAPSEVAVDFSATADDATNLLALYGAPVLPLTGLGPGATELRLKGSPVGGMAATMRLTGEDASAAFEGNASLSGDALALNGKVNVEAKDIEPWLTTLAMSLPGMGLGLPFSAEGEMTFDGARLSLPAVSGTISGVKVEGDLSAGYNGQKPELSGSLVTDFLPLDLLFGMVLGDNTLVGDGERWAEAPFPSRIVLPFDADLRVSAATIGFSGDTIAEHAAGQLRLDSGGLHIAELAGRVADGDLKGLFELRNDDGSGVASAQFSLSGATLSKLPGAESLGGKATISATLNGAGKTLSALVSSLTGTGTVVGQDVTIGGFDPDALQKILARADTIGRDINDSAVADFAPALAAAGSFPAGSPELAFSIAGGVLRAPPVTLSAPGAAISANIRADLSEWLVDVDGEISYEPGIEALIGSQPTLNFTSQGAPGEIERVLDPQPMAQFLTQRALEIEQARVEAMQAALIEKQRLRRETRYYAALDRERRAALAKAEEEARLAAEAAAKAKEEAEARLKAEEEARLKAEEDARLKAAADAKAEAQAKVKAEAEAKAKAEQEQKADAEARAKERREAEDATARQAKQKAIEEAEAVRKLAEQQKAARDADAAAKARALEEAQAQRQNAPPPQQAPRSPFLNLFNSITGGQQ